MDILTPGEVRKMPFQNVFRETSYASFPTWQCRLRLWLHITKMIYCHTTAYHFRDRRITLIKDYSSHDSVTNKQQEKKKNIYGLKGKGQTYESARKGLSVTYVSGMLMSRLVYAAILSANMVGQINSFEKWHHLKNLNKRQTRIGVFTLWLFMISKSKITPL